MEIRDRQGNRTDGNCRRDWSFSDEEERPLVRLRRCAYVGRESMPGVERKRHRRKRTRKEEERRRTKTKERQLKEREERAEVEYRTGERGHPEARVGGPVLIHLDLFRAEPRISTFSPEPGGEESLAWGFIHGQPETVKRGAGGK